MDKLLRQFRRLGSSSELRQYTLLWYGIRRHARHGMGMVDRHVLYPMCRFQHGGIMFINAYKWRTLLRRCCVGASVRLSLIPSNGLDIDLDSGWGPLAAWVTGWSNWLAQVTGAPSVNYAMSAMILAAGSITNPGFVPENYQLFLLTALIMIIHGCISSMPTKWIARFNSVGSTFNIIALFIVTIMIPAATNRKSQGLPKFTPAKEVWGSFYAGTDFPNGVALLMTFVAVIWTMRSVLGTINNEYCDIADSLYTAAMMHLSISAKNAPMPISHRHEPSF